MGQGSNIEWTDATWNPWYGCHKVSPGCAYCYMDRWANRSGREPDKVTRAADSTFYAPLKWKKPRRIFTCSLSDFFIEDREAISWRHEAWDIINRTHQHTYLILTKRIDTILNDELLWRKTLKISELKWPHNVWLGVSVENQRMADERIPKLLQIPAAVRFLSIEPLLGPIDIRRGLSASGSEKAWEMECGGNQSALDWVIVGGESGGPDHRRLVYNTGFRSFLDPPGTAPWEPKDKALKWVRSLRDQCQSSGVPFFFKQWGGPRPESAGRLLDGREWNENPGS